MNSGNNSRTRSLFNHHITLGLRRLFMSQAAEPHQNFQEYPGASTVKGGGEGPTWPQLWRQNLGQCDQIRIKSRGGLQTQEAKLGKNPTQNFTMS